MLLKDEEKISASMVSALKEAKETLPHMVKITEILFDKEGMNIKVENKQDEEKVDEAVRDEKATGKDAIHWSSVSSAMLRSRD